MNQVSKNNGPILKGMFYLILGLILGSSALGLWHFAFMKHLLMAAALYFLVCGLYYSGLYHTLMHQINFKK